MNGRLHVCQDLLASLSSSCVLGDLELGDLAVKGESLTTLRCQCKPVFVDVYTMLLPMWACRLGDFTAGGQCLPRVTNIDITISKFKLGKSDNWTGYLNKTGHHG